MLYTVHFRAAHKNDGLGQCFSTFLDSRHPSFLIEQFGGTPNYKLSLNGRGINILVAPLELFTAPKGSSSPLLRTTGLGL